jgi:hypothetical protein
LTIELNALIENTPQLNPYNGNGIKNLVLIKNHPYHKLITKYQKVVTSDLQEGDSININWPIPQSYLYPFEKIRNED